MAKWLSQNSLNTITNGVTTSESIYGNNTWMTADYPVKFTVVGGDNVWGTELMLYAGDNIESGSSSKNMKLEKFYVVSETTANKISVVEFLYGTAATAKTNIVITDATDKFTLIGHGFVNTDKIILSSVVTTTGLTANTVYYVIGVNGNDFQVSLTSGGAAVVVGGGNGTCSAQKLTQTSLTKFVNSKSATTSSSDPYRILCPAITCNNRLFIRAKSESGSTESIGFLLGVQTYSV